MNVRKVKQIQKILLVVSIIVFIYGLMMSDLDETKRDHNPQDIDINIVKIEQGVGIANFETVNITYIIKNNTEEPIYKIKFKTYVHDSKGIEIGSLMNTFDYYDDPIQAHAQATYKTSLSASNGYSDLFVELYKNGAQNVLFDLEITGINWKGGISNSDSTYVKTNYRVKDATIGSGESFDGDAETEQLSDETVNTRVDSLNGDVSSSLNTEANAGIEVADDIGENEQGDQPYVNSALSDEYILPDSDRRYYTEYELASYTEDQLRIARNEIYARCGRMFQDGDLAEYFNSKTWYRPSIPADEFDDAMLNAYEKANLELIRQIEERTGNSRIYENGTYRYVTSRTPDGGIGVVGTRTTAFKNIVCDANGLKFTQVLEDGTENNVLAARYYGRLPQMITDAFSADAEVYSAQDSNGTTVYIDIFDEYGMLRVTDSGQNEYYFVQDGGIDIKQNLSNYFY